MGLFSKFPFLTRHQPEPNPEPIPEPTPEPIPEPAEPEPVAAAVPAEPRSPAPGPARAQAEALVQQVVSELPNFLTVAVVDSLTGQILAGQWAGHSGGALEAAAANAAIVQQTRQAISALQLGPQEQLQDILITLRRQLHLLQVLPQQQWLLYLAIRTQDTNLALARTVLRRLAL